MMNKFRSLVKVTASGDDDILQRRRRRNQRRSSRGSLRSDSSDVSSDSSPKFKHSSKVKFINNIKPETVQRPSVTGGGQSRRVSTNVAGRWCSDRATVGDVSCTRACSQYCHMSCTRACSQCCHVSCTRACSQCCHVSLRGPTKLPML